MNHALRGPVLFCVLLFLSSFQCFADSSDDVILIYQKDKSFSISITQHISGNLNSRNITTRLIDLQSLKKSEHQQIPDTSLLVTLGSEATNELLKRDISNPILSLLIPKQSHSTLQDSKTGTNAWASLFIDQPVNRQFLLIKHLLGPQKTVGTLLGPYSIQEKSSLLSTARTHKQALQIQSIQITDQLIPALKLLTNESDVVLALPDPVAFNKKTIRGILLLTYREDIPVVGFSKSYVKAGAVASLYSEYDQISDQAVRIIRNFLRTRVFDSAIYYPDDFSIAINSKVARTLNIRLKPEDMLIELIKRDEGTL